MEPGEVAAAHLRLFLTCKCAALHVVWTSTLGEESGIAPVNSATSEWQQCVKFYSGGQCWPEDAINQWEREAMVGQSTQS